MFEYYGDKHVYCPELGADQIFQNHKSTVHLPVSFKFFSSNDILTIFPFQMHGPPMLTNDHALNWVKVINVMIYINFVELLSLMLHAKFQNHRPTGSGEDDY